MRFSAGYNYTTKNLKILGSPHRSNKKLVVAFGCVDSTVCITSFNTY